MSRGVRAPLAGLTLVAGGLAAGLLASEIILRLGGFQFRTFPTVHFGWPEPTVIAEHYVPDVDLFWVRRDYRQTLDAARRDRPAVVFMGDSCTEFGTYPRLTLARLSTRAPALARGIKVGVAGWSTEQGLAQLRRDILPLAPKVITIYFGWNDHWIAFGKPDADARPGRALFWLITHSRLAQLINKLRVGMVERDPSDSPDRVPISRYRDNLREMSRLAREAGIHAVLITAPSGHVPGHEPAYLAVRYLRRLDDLIPQHTRYVNVTREVAGLEHTTLCDAAARFQTLPSPIAQYFKKDGIHLSDHGNHEMASIVAGCIERAAAPAAAGSR